MGCQDDNGHPGDHAVQLLHERDAVLPHQLQVDHGQVEHGVLYRLPCFNLVGRGSHLVVRRLQPHPHQFQQVPVVINDQ
jgi:hypothetical protein